MDVCVYVVAVGLTAVSNGSCLTGPWEMESKRSIRYNVNNDPSSHCAAWDKSIKDPSHPVITLLCQQQTEKESERKEKRGSKREWIPKHKAIFNAAEQWYTLCQKMFTHIQWQAVFLLLSLFFFFLACICSFFCFGRFVAQWNASSSGVIPLLPHWLPINEAILTNTFWRLWNRFWKGVWMALLTKHVSC